MHVHTCTCVIVACVYMYMYVPSKQVFKVVRKTDLSSVYACIGLEMVIVAKLKVGSSI